jgi:type IV secretion system protein VirB10
MKAVTLSVITMALAIPVLAQSPGSVPPAAQAQPATTTAAPSAMASPTAADNSKIVVSAETIIPLILENTINTKSAYVGQAIYCESIYPIAVGNRIIIPKGTSVRGTVTQVVRPGRIKGRAQLGLRFDELVLPNGTTRQLRATLAGLGSAGDEKFKPNEGKVEGGGSKGKDAGTVARTTIPGAEIGTIVGAAKGAPLEGLGIGSAAGAATGLVWILASRGKDVVLPHGASLELQLSQPVTFDREEVEPSSRYDAGPKLPRRD